MRPRWHKLVIRGSLNGRIKREAHNASGAYAIREASSHAVVYVGKSECGKLWRTMLRHFQAPDSFETVRETGVFRRGPAPYEVAIWVTTKGKRACRKGDPSDKAAAAAEAKWIASLQPSRNVDDGAADFNFGANVSAPDRGHAFEGLIENPRPKRCRAVKGSRDGRGSVKLRCNPSLELAPLDERAIHLAGGIGQGKIKATDEGLSVRTSYGGHSWGAPDRLAPLVVFEGAATSEQRPLANWLTKAIRAMAGIAKSYSDRGLAWLIPRYTADSAEIAKYWLEIVEALPPVAIGEFARPWRGETGPKSRAGRLRGDLYGRERGDWIGPAYDSDAAQLVAMLAEMTDFAVVWKSIGRKKTAEALIRLADDSTGRTRAIALRLHTWLRELGAPPSELDKLQARAMAEALEPKPKKKPRATSLRDVVKAVEAGPAHSLAVAAAPFDEGDPLVRDAIDMKYLAIHEARGRWPRRYVTLNKGLWFLGSFDATDESFHEDSHAISSRERGKRKAAELDAAAREAAGKALAKQRAELGTGTVETKGKHKGQLRLFNPRSLKPGQLVELGKLTELEWIDDAGKRHAQRWAVSRAPILAYDSAGKLAIVYGGKRAGKASSSARAEYSRTHWGKAGKGDLVAGGVLEGAAKEKGRAISVIYTTTKGDDARAVDYWHVFGEAASSPRWTPPTLRGASVRGVGEALRLEGGSYRVTTDGIVG